MFNNIDNSIYREICDMLFAYHNMMVNSYKELNKFFNSSYCPKSIKTDILDILQQYIYMSDVDLSKMGF